MDRVDRLIKNMPLFRHCTPAEIGEIRKKARNANVRRGQKLDIGRSGTLYLVINGIFEITTTGRKTSLYISNGSFFGEIPFLGHDNRGSATALSDSSVLFLEFQDLYRFFLGSFKAFRGYIQAAKRSGFILTPAAVDLAGKRCSVVSVFSAGERTGKTLFAALLGVALSKSGRTIILDMSYRGDSLFGHFERTMPPALSQKMADETTQEFINDRIIAVDDRLAILNIVQGSKVAIDPRIIAPVLFFLAKNYRTIIMDISNADPQLRDAVFLHSDMLFALIKGDRDREGLYPLFDSTLRDGQRIYYVLNRFCAPHASAEGALSFDVFSHDPAIARSEQLRRWAEHDAVRPFVDIVSARRRALVFQSHHAGAVAYAGFLKALDIERGSFSVLYGSAWSAIILLLYLLSTDTDQFVQDVVRFFSERHITSLLAVAFPDESVFTSGTLLKRAGELGRGNRIEFFQSLLLIKAGDGRYRERLFSSGGIRELIAACFGPGPLFEGIPIAGSDYNSGFPMLRTACYDLLRMDMDDIAGVSVKNKGDMPVPHKSGLGFYWRYLDQLEALDDWMGDDGTIFKNCEITIDLKETRFKHIIMESEQISKNLIKNIG